MFFKDADRAISDLRAGKLDYVQLSIDVSAETINLEAHETGARLGYRMTAMDVVERTAADKPRYHIFVYQYTHEGDAKISTGNKNISHSSFFL